MKAKGRHQGMVAVALSLASCLLLVLSPNAPAQGPEAGLADAEARAAAAETDATELESVARLAEAKLEAAKEQAAPVRSEAERAADRVAATESSLRRTHRHAVATVRKVEEERSDAAKDHDEEVASGIGFAVAALVLALITLAWGWFRASAAVAYLARIQLGQAIGLCVGGGFAAVLVGAAIGSAGGLAEAVGVAILSLGLMLPVALLLGRHSAEVQRGRAKPVLGRERVPVRATQVIAALFALLFVSGLGSALFASEAESGEITSKTRELAEDEEPSSQALTNAEDEATELEGDTAPLLATLRRRRADLDRIERQLGKAEIRLSDAERDARGFGRQLLVIEKREIREREEEERAAAKLIAREEREAREEAVAAEEEAAEECNPNYSGCLDPYASDYDCASGSGDGPLYTGTVEVIGYDEYGLDDDGDGIGCDLG
jgi:hypothetical protein